MKDDGTLRTFESGATRDTAEGKLDFEGFLSPGVLHQFARYMNMNRLQSDGSLRTSDNWQKGISKSAYMKSAWRHFFEWWAAHRLCMSDPNAQDSVGYMAAMCGLLFNVMGYMHEWLKTNSEVRFDEDEPTVEMQERLRTQAKEELKIRYGFNSRNNDSSTCFNCKFADKHDSEDPCNSCLVGAELRNWQQSDDI